MTEKEKQIIEGLFAKRVILQNLGVSESVVERVNSIPDADALISFYEKKNSEKTESENKKNSEPEKKEENKQNKTLEQKKAEIEENAVMYEAEELFSPLHVDNKRLNMQDPKNGRILKIYDDSRIGRIF